MAVKILSDKIENLPLNYRTITGDSVIRKAILFTLFFILLLLRMSVHDVVGT